MHVPGFKKFLLSLNYTLIDKNTFGKDAFLHETIQKCYRHKQKEKNVFFLMLTYSFIYLLFEGLKKLKG